MQNNFLESNMLLELAKRLDQAANTATAIEQLSNETQLDLTQAYEIQKLSIEQRLARGEQLVGIKMGFTSRAKMEQMGVDDLIWGRLTNTMIIEQDQAINLDNYVHPRAEPEIAFRLNCDLAGEISFEQAVKAIEAIAPAIEVIDSRYQNFKFSLADVIADNCSSTGFIVGPWQSPNIDISNLHMKLGINNETAMSGPSSEILEHPINSLIEAARIVAEYGESLKAGQIVLAGAATAAVALERGQTVSVEVENLGGCSFKTV